MNFSNFFSGSSYLSTETKVATGAVLLAGTLAFYLYKNCCGSNPVPIAGPSVIHDGNKKLTSQWNNQFLRLEYEGARPDEANSAFKKTMAKTIKLFLETNQIPITHDLPEESKFTKYISNSRSTNFCVDNVKIGINHESDSLSKVYKIIIGGDQAGIASQRDGIVDIILHWRKAFNLTAAEFAEE